MRSFAKAVLVVVTLATVVQAQTSQPKRRTRTHSPASACYAQTSSWHARTRRSRRCCSACARWSVHDDMSRLFPGSGYGRQRAVAGRRLAADAFWQFGDAIDRTLSLRLFAALTARYPGSTLAMKVGTQTTRLQAAKSTAHHRTQGGGFRLGQATPDSQPPRHECPRPNLAESNANTRADRACGLARRSDKHQSRGIARGPAHRHSVGKGSALLRRAD
jgi:hypothetical protein